MWWAVLLATYLAIISAISVAELVVGALVAAAGAVVAVVTRRALLTADSTADSTERYLPRPAWLRWLLPLPVQILTDSIRLLRPRGGFAELRLPDDDRSAALRGFAALAVSASPGTYVAEVRPGRGDLVPHPIGRRPSAVEREITR